MLIPILCFTCGCPLGDKEDLYNYLKKERINKTKEGDDLDCLDILHLLDIVNDCCKMHFISSMLITDYY
jgi:DNA-directed RNA polymerase subunit N (RpoN/RPB10)